MERLLTENTIKAIERPDPSLMTYYVLRSFALGPLFPLMLVPLYFRYYTMRYRFTDEGISMRWGILFRREVIVNYARIQDIHLHSNVVERWLGLARILIQTASASASAEMTIEGIKEFEALRDHLYFKMRGVKEHPPGAAPMRTDAGLDAVTSGELAAALREAAAELRALRATLETRK